MYERQFQQAITRFFFFKVMVQICIVVNLQLASVLLAGISTAWRGVETGQICVTYKECMELTHTHTRSCDRETWRYCFCDWRTQIKWFNPKLHILCAMCFAHLLSEQARRTPSCRQTHFANLHIETCVKCDWGESCSEAVGLGANATHTKGFTTCQRCHFASYFIGEQTPFEL